MGRGKKRSKKEVLLYWAIFPPPPLSHFFPHTFIPTYVVVLRLSLPGFLPVPNQAERSKLSKKE